MKNIDLLIEKYLGDTKVLIKKPKDCTDVEKNRFIELVISGGQNVESHVRNSFDKLIWVGLLYSGDEIVSVSSLKRGNSKPFERAGVEGESKNYLYEVGFSYTDKDSRGLGYNKLLKVALFKKIGNKGVYCTIRTTNKASILVNSKLGFKPLGKTYQGIVDPIQLMVKG